tara:strand:+ start:68 stop:745 length:678 start_codon:yes stop_codon:yes gene_type:complete
MSQEEARAATSGGEAVKVKRARSKNRWKKETTLKRKYGVKKLVNDVAAATLKGNGIGLRQSAGLAYVTNDDKRIIQRIVGMSVEKFNERLMGKLDRLTDLVIDRMIRDIDDMPMHTLPFAMAVTIDKKRALAGASATAGSNVNIQVNNFGSMSKEDIIAKLSGKMDIGDAGGGSGGSVQLAEEVVVETEAGEAMEAKGKLETIKQQKMALKKSLMGDTSPGPYEG